MDRVLDDFVANNGNVPSVAMLTMTTPANNQLAYNSRIGLIWREAAANPGWFGHTGYVLFTNEGVIDGLVGPGSELNRTIREWLDQLKVPAV